MTRIRVLIIDDSVVIRRLMTDILSEDPEIEVAGTAATGTLGLAKISQTNPDLVTLDIEMPGMSGLEVLPELRKHHPRLPVVMFSSMTERAAAATLDALALGANDYVTKPANAGSIQASMQAVRESLIPKIKALCGRSPATAPPQRAASRVVPRQATAAPAPTSAKTDVVAIGVSTGGPNALAALFSQLPAELPVPVLIVQHMPPVFTKLLAERLDRIGKLRVTEVAGGELLTPGGVWLARGDHHLLVRRTTKGVVLETNQDPPENSCRPAVDPLFRSVATVYGPRALAVVLTGMGHDGLRGVEAIREAGGRVLVQDEATSVVWGMPGAIVQAGLADRVLPLDALAPEIVRCVGRGRAAVQPRAAAIRLAREGRP